MRSELAPSRASGVRLDGAQRAELLRRSRLRSALQIVAIFGIYAAAALVITTPRLGPARFAVWPLMGLVLAGFPAAAHDCFHSTLLHSKRANRIAGALFTGAVLGNFTAVKHAHLVHHRFTGVEGDGEEPFDFASAGAYVRFLLFTPFFILRGPVRAAAILLGFVRPKYVESARAQRGARIDGAVVLVWFAILVACTIHAPIFMVLVYWGPLALFPPLALAIAIPEHYGCTGGGDLFAAGRTTKSNAFVRMLIWNSNFHVEHHLHPGVPSCNLPALHRMVEHKLVNEAPGYLAFHVGVVRDLLQRRRPLAAERRRDCP